MSRSDCPIANALDYIGDKWSLLILRDISLFNKRTYSEMQESKEHIATNILADRLNKLENAGIIYKTQHPNDKRKNIFYLTEKGFDLIPLILDMIIWSKKYYVETFSPDDFLLAAQNDREKLIMNIINKNKEEQSY